MRTKQYLAALCLPLAFAACSDEEFVTDTPSLGSRGTVNVTINAKKPGFDGVNTRMGINNDNQFVWEKDVDMIGAALADGAAKNTIANKVYVNYPFTAQSSATASAFNSKSAIAEGHYLFYYGYADHLGRGEMDLSAPAQTYKVGGKASIQQAVGYMKMISPIVNLSKGVGYKDAQNYNLNLSFVNLYTMVKVVITSKNIKADTTPKLKKVTLNATGGSGFVKTATVNMTEIAGSMDANVVAPDEETGQIAKADMDKKIEAVKALVEGAADGTVSDIYEATAQGAVELTIDGDLTLSETKNDTVYILAPKGTYNSGLTLTVETSEGVYTKEITKGATDLKLADQIQPISADVDFSKNVKAPTTFSIGSAADWNNAIEFIENHLKSYIGALPTFDLTADVAITSLPAYAIPVTATAAHTLTFSEDFILDEDGSMPSSESNNVTLCVGSGATLTLNDDCAFKTIQNSGILNVNLTQSAKIVNYGTMNVGGNATVELGAGLENGKAAITDPATAAAAIEGTINILEGKALTIGTTILNNNAGTINVNGTLTNSIINSTNAAKIVVGAKGTLTGTPAFKNSGIIDNFGTLSLTDLANENGTVIAQKGGKGGGSAKTIKKGTVKVIDGADFATLQSGSDAYGFGSMGDAPMVTIEVTSDAEYDAVKGSDVTNITLTAQREWKIGGDGLAAPTNAANLTLKDVKLTIGANLSKNIIVEGTSASTVTAASAFTITGALTVNEGATLNVENYVTFNAAETTIDAKRVAKILGTLNVKAGAAMYFDTAEVGSETVSNAKLSVEGNITTGGINAGKFGVYLDGDDTKFKNYGAIASLTGETSGADNAGQITKPQSQTGTATTSGMGVGADISFS